MRSAEWKKNVAIMWFAQFIGMSAITGVIAFLPLYLTHLGVEEQSIGLWAGVLMAASSFCAALSNPYWGSMADRKGRKPMVEKVLFMFALIIVAMSYVTNVYQLLTLRILQGLCGGFVAASTALVVSMSPKEEIPFTVGLFQTALIVGGAAGPMIGGLIADTFGYRVPFLFFGVFCLTALALVRFAVTEHFTPVPKSEGASLRQTFADVWGVVDLRIMLLVQFLAQFAVGSIAPILPLYIQSMLTGQDNLASIAGTIIAIAGVTSAVMSASMGCLCKHFSHKQILTTAAVLGAVSFAGQLLATDVITLSVLRGLNGLCIGAMVPSSNTIITYLIPEAKRGAAYGVTSGASLMGNVLGPISAGLLARFFGLSAIFWLTSALFAAVAFLLFDKIKNGDSYQPAEALQTTGKMAHCGVK